MKRKGFTIVELLAVITILALGTLIIVPSVFSSLDKAKLKEYNRIVTSIEEATENYYLNNQEEFSSITPTNPGYVSLETLAMNGYVKKPLENPRGEGEFNYRTLVKLSKTTEGFLECEFTNAYFKEELPILEEIAIGSTYTINSNDVIAFGMVEIQVNGTTITTPYSINTASAATYTVAYHVSSNQKTASLIRTIVVH